MENQKTSCIIFAAGDYQHNPDVITISDNDFIIAADGGYTHALNCGYVPKLLIGDFDSLKDIPKDIEKIPYPVKKDNTDTHIAIEYAFSKGFKNISVLGALGGKRFDHSFSNIQSGVHFANLGANITLTDGNTFIKLVHNDKISFDKCMTGYISVFSASEKSLGVSIKGLEYELENHTLTNDFPLGVSNEFVGKPSEVSVEHGTLIIIFQHKKP